LTREEHHRANALVGHGREHLRESVVGNRFARAGVARAGLDSELRICTRDEIRLADLPHQPAKVRKPFLDAPPYGVLLLPHGRDVGDLLLPEVGPLLEPELLVERPGGGSEDVSALPLRRVRILAVGREDRDELLLQGRCHLVPPRDGP